MNYFRIRDLTEQELSRLLMKAQEEDDNEIEGIIFKVTSLKSKIESRRAGIADRCNFLTGRLSQIKEQNYNHSVLKPDDRNTKFLSPLTTDSLISLNMEIQEVNDLEEQLSFLKNLNFKR